MSLSTWKSKRAASPVAATLSIMTRRRAKAAAASSLRTHRQTAVRVTMALSWGVRRTAGLA